MICNNITVNNDGVLCFGGKSTVELAKKYGTPLYVFDENTILDNCRVYVNAMKKYFDNSRVLYAGKAACFKRIYEIIKDTEMYIDVVSSGEIYTALSAGFPLERAYFHGNNKTDYDIEFAIDNSVGCFVVDNFEELLSIDNIAKQKNTVQPILLRVTPGIDPHTYEAVATGKVDSKFGSSIETGDAERITAKALELENVLLKGFHCHVGSQVFDSEVFIDSGKIMFRFISLIKEKYGYEAEQLNLGGGYGVRYVDGDPEIDIDKNIEQLSNELKKQAAEFSVKMPTVLLEPGRSIVADAGMTLYTVGTVKQIKGYKNYVSIDGGMTDNPRYALYKSDYTVFLANKAQEKCDFPCSLVGRCCESGDIIKENAVFPKSVRRGDIVAVATTGAYNYSMASNYNRIPRPAVVVLSDGNDKLAVKRESFEDLIKNDL